MANPFDQFDAPAANPFDKFDEPAKPSGMIRKIADKGLGFVSGAVGATKAIADAAGAGNAVSGALGSANEVVNDYLSPEAKADQQEQSAIMAGAKGQGAWEGVKSGARAFGVAPVQTAIQGLGSIVPVIAGGIAGLPGAVATGVAMGAGTAKGAIYDEIKKRGGTEEEATQAQAYDGKNTDQIALGGALGAADALTGVSRIAGGMVRNAIGKPVSQAVTTGVERGVIGRAGMGMLGEMPLEAAQGGQEQVAANLAAQRAGYQAGTWDNVASNATLEALASAGPGAAFGAFDRKAAPEAPPPTPVEQVPPLQIGNTPDPMISFADGTVARQSEVDQYINGLPPDQQPAARAKLMGMAPQPAKPSEAMGLTPTAAPSLTNAAIVAVDSGASQQSDPVKSAQDEYRAQTAAMLQQQGDDQAYKAYMDAIEQASTAQDEAPGETIAAVTPIANVLAEYDHLSDDEFFAALGATPEEIQNAATDQPSSPQASAANLESIAQDVAGSQSESTQPVDAKAANLERIRAANRPQPTTLGTQINAVAGPGFSAKDVVKAPNVGTSATAPVQENAPNQPVSQAEQTQVATESVAPKPARPKAIEESQQDKVNREWGENYSNVANTDDLATVSTKDLERASNYATFRMQSEGRKGWDGGQVNTALIDSIKVEAARVDAALKERRSTTTTPAPGTSAKNPTKSEQAKADIEHLFGLPEKRAKAIERIAKGTAYFSLPLKAQEFIAKNGLKETHQSVKTARGWDIVAKSQPTENTSAQAPKALEVQTKQPEAPAAAKPVTPQLPPAAPVKEYGAGFEPIGARAFSEGKPRLLPTELRGLKHSMIVSEWYAGWDAAKANSPAAEVAPKKDDGTWMAAGWSDFAAGKPRVLPSYFTKPGDKNSKDWYRGWDAANIAAPAVEQVPTKPKAAPLKQRIAQERQARADYFTPGNIVTSYGGHDEVLSYTPPKEDGGGWSVKVHAVKKVNGEWVRIGKPQDARTHSTQPDAQALKAGPLEKVNPTEAGNVTYTEPRADGSPFPNAHARGAPVEQVPVKAPEVTAQKPAIVVDKAEMRPYRKPDGSVGYEAVPIVDSKPADGQQDELDAEMRSYEAKANPTYSGEPAKAPEAAKPDTLSDKEKAAKAKMFNALGKLAALAGKNTRMNWTPEEEQQLLPIVIELFDGAMELGSVTFQKAVRYVREFIAGNLDQATADAIPFETLQGAYIHTARKYKDQGATTGKEVMGFDSLEELDKSAEKVDIETKDNGNEQETTTGNVGRSTDKSVSELRRDVVDGGRPGTAVGSGDSVQENATGKVPGDAGNLRAKPAKRATGGNDFTPAIGGLTREGSWFDTAKRNIDLIELAIKIESENRAATPAEQAQLAKYVGFGASAIRNDLFPVPPAYAKAQEPNRLIWPQYVRNERFKPLAERIEALPREWQQSILQSSQYAHYTSEGIIRSVWSALQRMGFIGGNVFEPGMGIGSFAMLMPNTIKNTSRYTGVEFDAPTALIARLLSPDQNMIHGDFIKKRFPENFFDVNVGNPPFSQTKILGDPKYAKNGFMLHDFFFAKGIDLVRPGGIQVFVTSKGTMDKQNDKARKYLSDRADLLGAIRLPSTAFEDNAGTSVVTDVIFLRKRTPGEPAAGEAWAGTASVETKDGPVLVNEYFAKHPEMVLGQQRISGNTDDMGRRINSNGMGGEKYTVVSYDTTAAELDAKFAKAITNLPKDAYLEQANKPVKDETAKIDFDPSVKREGVVYTAKDGTIMRVAQGVGKPLEGMVKLSDKDKEWFKSYVGLRDLVQESRFAQLNDGEWEKSLAKLNKAHDKFVKEHGHIQDFRILARKSTDEDGNVITTEIRIPKNNRLFREDYDRALVTSLEEITEDGTIIKAPFLKGRTIGKPVSRDVRTIGDALAVSLDENGTLNLDDVAQRMKLSRDEVIDSLGSQIYQTPTGQWQLADEYLAGDVVAKLEEAEQAARLNPELQRNVEALKAAQPEKLGPSQISAKLGASWIPESHVNEFSEEIGAGSVTFDPKTETWTVQGGNERSARKAGAEYGTAKRSPSELLEAILNSRSIKITQVVDKKTVQDEAATTAANEMAKKIKDKFKGWVWTDTSRASDLVEGYNKHFNNIAPRRFDGAHLTLPGVSLRYKLHPHQLRAIWRQIQTGNTYLAHAVGAGKTIEMIAGGMEQKRLGLIKKPMYVVPNHMLEQFSNEFMELYPLANIMVADDENFSADRRKEFIASATLNNPDAIIITHDAFQRIGVKEESVAPIRDEILSDLEIELSETAKDNDSRVRRGQLQQQIEAVTQRFDKIIGAGQKDSTIKFEDMGVDFVYADEAHVFRKLDFHTAQSIKGIDPNGSKRALDMYVKTRILEKNKPGRSFSFASGTPVTNTMGELYTIMRFFAGAELDKSGISTFDAWARQFGEVVAALEPNAAGAYQIVERFAKFDNVPELMSRVRQFMDVLTSDNLGALVKRPDLAGGKPNLNIIPTNAALTEYMKGELARRIEISKAWKPSPGEKGNPDPIVSIITDGRFAAIDPRFFGGTMQDGETSIITEMGDSVAKNYHATKNTVYTGKDGKPEAIKGSTQIVFYNLGFGEGAQRSRGFNARDAFTKRLTDGGIPRHEIAWFDDANTDAKKEAVFKDMRSGKLKVLIGSAKKMGTGVNVQKRLGVLHYQDPPWFPADVEQPHGRIIRQGNQNSTVAIEWYTTKGTYQSTMWQMVGRKQRFIDQAFTGDKTMRSMDDLGEASLFEQAAAVASGDPRAIQLAGLKQDVERFERLQAAHASEQISVRTNLRSAQWHVKVLQEKITQLAKAFKTIGEKYFSLESGKVGNASYTKAGEFGQAVKDAFNKVASDSLMEKRIIGKQIASIGDVLVKMDSSLDKNNQLDGKFDLYVEFGGMTFQISNSSAMGIDVDAVGLTRRILNQVNSVSTDLSDSRRRLIDEETDSIKLSKKLGAPFEHQQEMAEKYGELKRLEAELKAEGEAKPDVPLAITPDGEIGAGATFSTRTSAPEKQFPLNQIERLVQSALRGVKNAPTVRVVASPEAIGLRSPVDTVPSGVTLANGDIYVFQSGVGSALDVDMVVFHEVFHKGLQNVMPKADYVAAMQEIAKADSKVRQYASEWSDSKAAKSQMAELAKKYSGKELADQYEALAIEEGLARIAEDLKAKREMGTKAIRVRRLVAWLAKVADKIGMTRLANSIRALSYNAAEKFVVDTIGKAGGNGPNGGVRYSAQNGTSATDRFKARDIGDTLASAANSVRDVNLPAGYKVADLINGAPGKLGWWSKTVGTQYHLAQKSPAFKRVFDGVQTFLNDVSYFATEAADLAPSILPKLETWKDIGKSPVSAVDTKAFSAPVFDGTLNWGRDESGKAVKMAVLENAAKALTVEQKAQRLLRNNHISEQVLKMWQGLPIDQFEAIIEGKFERDMLKAGAVFTDGELRQHFNLTPNQIKLYREFRKTTDKSLTNLAIADMLRFGGKDVAPIREDVLASKNVTEAADTLSKYLLSLTDIEPDRSDVLTDTANKMIDKGNKAKDLMDRGYAPLSRFGQYTLDVVHNGERVYFGMFESKWEAARMNRNMQTEYPGAQITQGTVSEEAYKLFAGVSPETLELFGDMLGLEAQGDGKTNEAFQEYLKLAKSNRSAMKRLIQRKGIAGFNEDAGRVLAGFVYSNARQTSSSLHMGEMTNAVNDMPKQQGELKDAAVKLVDYIKNPQEEAQALRGLLFTQYIGGSIASAMVNMTQPLTMTFPWLSQFGGVASAGKQMSAAMQDALKKRTGDATLDAAIKRAEEDGTVSPQEVHQLMQQAQGRGALRSGDGTTAGDLAAKGSNALSRFSLGWGKLFSAAEQFNRRVTFIAAYRTAVAQKMADPDAFARRAISETQGIYNKGNKPQWARGAAGGVLFTFKQYSVAYIEMLLRMSKNGPEGKKAALLALGVLFLLSGASGLPGADDLDDIISGAMQSMGYNFDSKQKRKEFFVSLLGEDGARFMERGVSGLPGVPIDVAGRMGLGNLIPGTGLFQKKPDHTRDVAELFGPGGDFVKRSYEAAGKTLKGEVFGPRGAIMTAAPKAMQNLAQAYDMANMGMYRDTTGKKVLDTDASDSLVKALGFQPNDVARVQDASFDVQRMIGVNKMRESEIAGKWATGLFEKDTDKVQEARLELSEWNADNPTSPIRINFKQIMQRVNNMKLDKSQRLAKTAPKEIRAAVKQELSLQ